MRYCDCLLHHHLGRGNTQHLLVGIRAPGSGHRHYPALPKAISCKQYYSWPMMFSLSLFSKKTWRQWRTCISWARDCVNINWGLELLEHTTYGAYNSVGIPHPLDALATTPKALETTYENPCPLQTMHHPTFTSNISLMLLRINTPHGTTTSLCLISVHS